MRRYHRIWLASLPACLMALTCASPVSPVSAKETAAKKGSTGTSSIVDTLIFGDATSEQAHRLTAERSETLTGGLGAPARRLLPLETTELAQNWQGGHVAFTLKVDPIKPNYITVRLFGNDISPDRLMLYCEGKQIGYRHLGDVDCLDFGSNEPAYNGRFFYTTTPLPMELTRGRTELHCEIRSTGAIWPYGDTFERYQKPMTEPTRGLYRIYSHTDGYFVPPAEEKQGSADAHARNAVAPVRSEPGPAVLDRLKARVNGEIDRQLSSGKPLPQMQMQFLARAYSVPWTNAYKNPKVVTRERESLDAVFATYRKNPHFASSDPATWNADWFGIGPSGDVIRLLAEPLKPWLDAPISDGMGSTVARRAAYSEMLVACRDWHRKRRRLYSNQTMINDLYGIYLANRGVAVVDPSKALSETEVKRYLYESVGLQPWLDSDPGGTGAAETGGKSWGIGKDYFEITQKGLTRELGYVGSYGEVIDWMTAIYNATRPGLNQPGDEKIKAQLIKVARARGIFRLPALDAEGKRAMRLETIIGWRDLHNPGDITYAQRSTWDAGPMEVAATTLDPYLVGYAQQMLADHQFFASVEERMKDKGFRVTAGLLGTPDEYETIKAQLPVAYRLPMTPGQPDFVFTDEEDGVVALKRGDEILYASLYWRARNGINNLARIHDMTPQFSRIAVVRQESQFTPSGLIYTRPDWTDFGFAGGGHHYPGEWHSALAGEQLPIARIPEGVNFRSGDESVYAGKAEFYRCQYGDYLIGMNTTTGKSFELTPPASGKTAQDLVTGKRVSLAKPLPVPPRSTVVLYLGGSK